MLRLVLDVTLLALRDSLTPGVSASPAFSNNSLSSAMLGRLTISVLLVLVS